ncbi:TPA: hypothetical protein ACH3X1_013096 [Trebouxia sp. C0004]
MTGWTGVVGCLVSTKQWTSHALQSSSPRITLGATKHLRRHQSDVCCDLRIQTLDMPASLDMAVPTNMVRHKYSLLLLPYSAGLMDVALAVHAGLPLGSARETVCAELNCGCSCCCFSVNAVLALHLCVHTGICVTEQCCSTVAAGSDAVKSSIYFLPLAGSDSAPSVKEFLHEQTCPISMHKPHK